MEHGGGRWFCGRQARWLSQQAAASSLSTPAPLTLSCAQPCCAGRCGSAAAAGGDCRLRRLRRHRPTSSRCQTRPAAAGPATSACGAESCHSPAGRVTPRWQDLQQAGNCGDVGRAPCRTGGGRRAAAASLLHLARIGSPLHVARTSHAAPQRGSLRRASGQAGTRGCGSTSPASSSLLCWIVRAITGAIGSADWVTGSRLLPPPACILRRCARCPPSPRRRGSQGPPPALVAIRVLLTHRPKVAGIRRAPLEALGSPPWHPRCRRSRSPRQAPQPPSLAPQGRHTPWWAPGGR